MSNPLHALDQLDRDIIRLTKDDTAQAAAFERIAGGAGALKAELDAHDKAHHALLLAEREVERRVKQLDADIRHAEATIRSVTAKDAFEAAQREEARKRAELDAAGTEGLELIDKLEASKAHRTAIEARIARHREDMGKATAHRDAALAASAAKRAEVNTSREALLAALEPGVRNKYLELIETIGHPVFTRERDGCCAECGGEMARGVSSRVADGGSFVACTTCARIVLV